MYVPTKYEMPKIPKVRAKRKIRMEDVFEGVKTPPNPQSKSPVVGKGVIAPPSSSRQVKSPHQPRPQTPQSRTQRPYAQKS